MSASGTVYLLHFDRPYKHARHYIGWTPGDLNRRLHQHRNGSGARLMEVVTAAGIGFVVARIWDGGRNLERSLKRRGGASRSCPLCGVTPRVTGWDHPGQDTSPADITMPHEITLVSATCGCNRVTSIAASLLATASFTCSQCHQSLVPIHLDSEETHHVLTV
ncbi:hypothetical protein EDD27_6027 [Nonomuraea polychroma]|uniref:GIY-YIG catalytic domain-containing protein n=1 Tax=Nonomuraea polychroma TaxID=46176 RepID=A0A438MCA3_9ACTN|nr:hypothetical protein [Nonomuraea polychroma]RVX43346.1 hypothetical protein EDD27_6027 [Nonomuraea polychroma]